ncbi:hypothetical protein Ancab_016827 [Ancistrocladus abbreviatus]
MQRNGNGGLDLYGGTDHIRTWLQISLGKKKESRGLPLKAKMMGSKNLRKLLHGALVEVDGKRFYIHVFEETSGEMIFAKAGDRGLATQSAGSEGHDDNGKNVVGSWTSIIPCTLEGSSCNCCFASLEKENVHGQEQPCSQKVLDVSHTETSNNADVRDAIHMPSSGKRLKGAFKEDMRDSAEKLEKGTPSGNTAGTQSLPKFLQGGGSRPSGEDGQPNSTRIGRDLERSEPSAIKEKLAKPIMGQGPASKASAGRANIEGLKKKIKPKITKKAKKKMTSPAEKGQGGLRRERSSAGGMKGSDQLSGVSIGDSNIENMNRVIMQKMKTEEATTIWDIGKRLGVQSSEDEQEVIQQIAQLQGWMKLV